MVTSRGKKHFDGVLAGLDLGSSAIRIAIGQFAADGQGGHRLHIIGAAEAPSEGMHKGVITSLEDVVSSISHSLEQAERYIGVPVDRVWVGMNGTHIVSQTSKGVVAIAKTDGEISGEDIERAVEATRMIAPPLNYEVLHVMPYGFTVDGQTGIRDPVGMTGMRLEVDTRIVYGLTAHMKNMMKAVYRTGVDIHDLVLSVLAVGELVTTAKQRELGVAVVDIGGSTTSLVVYEGGDVTHIATLPIGSEHITNDLAIGLRTSIDIAEEVKRTYGDCVGRAVTKKDMIDLASVGAPESESVRLSYIVEIIQARVAELLEKVDAELARIHRQRLLPSGLVFTGGGSRLRGLVECAKEVLGLPASVGYPLDIESSTDKLHDLGYMTAIGLVRWGARVNHGGDRTRRFSVSGVRVFEKVQHIFRSLMP